MGVTLIRTLPEILQAVDFLYDRKMKSAITPGDITDLGRQFLINIYPESRQIWEK